MSDNSTLTTINKNLSLIADRLTGLETGQKELRTGQDGIITRLDNLEAGQRGLIKHAKSTDKTLREIKKDINYMMGEFDEGIVKNTRRIERIESHLGLHQPKD